MNLDLLEALHPEDRAAMRDAGFDQLTAPAQQRFVMAMLLETARALKQRTAEDIDERIKALRKESTDEIRDLKAQLRDTQARLGQYEIRSAPVEQRLLALEKQCDRNRVHCENLEKKYGNARYQ